MCSNTAANPTPTSRRASTPQRRAASSSRVRRVGSSRRQPKSNQKIPLKVTTSRKRKERKQTDTFELGDDADFDDGYNHLFGGVAVCPPEDFTEDERSQNSSASLSLSNDTSDPCGSDETEKKTARMQKAYSYRGVV